MNPDYIDEVLISLKSSIDNDQFYPQIFSWVVKKNKVLNAHETDEIKKICNEEYDNLSKRLERSQLQESTTVRNVLRTRALANLLINDKGDLMTELLAPLSEYLALHLYSLGPERQYDSIRQEHILKVVKLLQENKSILIKFKTITKPYSNPFADQIIRDTLQLPENTLITDAHTRRAVLSAWMCYLRQNIGSCFATAPAILVHDEQPEQFLTDINEILSTGRLKRTYGGLEYSVPLSITWGAGDLKKIIFLSKKDEKVQQEIWLSPGLNAALEAIGLIDPMLATKKKIELIKQLIEDLVHSWKSDQPYYFVSIEKLLRGILLKKMRLTEQDIHHYENRPRGTIQGGILVQAPQIISGSLSKNEACSLFFVQMQKAENAFKVLADNALLKSWEFTLASLSENKSGFTRWNLYSSLGLKPEEPGGIGECLYKVINTKLEETNRQVQEHQIEYEQIYTHVKYLETRIKSASESEAQWLKSELQSKVNEFYSMETMRDRMSNKAHRLANLYNLVMDYYDELFPRYFQEVYDADIHDVSSGPYDDSPAGFRLIYKHGRSNTSQWTRIYGPQDYIESLVNFFITTETEMANAEEMQGIQDVFSELVSSLIAHIKTKEFLETSFYRMARAHQGQIVRDPLEHLDRIEKKPWVYTSGGSMSTLVTCYFRREQPPTTVERWVENPMELLVFFIDSLKQIPHKIMEQYIINPQKTMLMNSPTHAFLLKPGLQPFRQAWQTEAFTYTWVRDELVAKMQRFIERISLDSEMMDYLIQYFLKRIPEDYQHFFRRVSNPIYATMTSSEFREFIVDKIENENSLKPLGRGILTADDIDSALFSLLPLFHIQDLKEKVLNIFRELPHVNSKGVEKAVDTIIQNSNSRIVNAEVLQNICKATLSRLSLKTTSYVDYHRLISEAAQKLGYAMPKPIIFADTNWVKDDFAFVVNPGTGKLELWRMDINGSQGSPMSIWQQWVNGTRRDRAWGIYKNPIEYTS